MLCGSGLGMNDTGEISHWQGLRGDPLWPMSHDDPLWSDWPRSVYLEEKAQLSESLDKKSPKYGFIVLLLHISLSLSVLNDFLPIKPQPPWELVLEPRRRRLIELWLPIVFVLWKRAAAAVSLIAQVRWHDLLDPPTEKKWLKWWWRRESKSSAFNSFVDWRDH